MRDHADKEVCPEIQHLYRLIAFTSFLAIAMDYIDRNGLGVLASTIQKDLALIER